MHGRFLLAKRLQNASPQSAQLNQVRWFTSASENMEKHKDQSIVKRKVAIVAGYSGTGYYGMQHNASCEFPTIEYELCEALHKAGCISEENLHSLKKIGWSRTSRTDKGVHASCIVASAKLLVDSNSINPSSGRIRGLPAQINQFLPRNIQVFSATHVNKSFRAHASCNLREYEYFLPVGFLRECIIRMNKGEEVSEEENELKIQTFKDVMEEFEGSHDFHNFTRKTEQRWKRDKKGEPSPIRTNAMKQMTQRHIYSSKCDDEPFMLGDIPMIRFEVRAQAFMLHQIRCMIGAAIAVACGAIPLDYFRAALHTDMKLYFPLVPPIGLVLKNCAFSGKGGHQLLRLERGQRRERIISPNMPSQTETRILLFSAEDNLLQQFRDTTIYPSVKKAWTNEAEEYGWIDKTVEQLRGLEYDKELLNEELAKAKEEMEKVQRRQHEMIVSRRKKAVTEGLVFHYRELLPRFFAGRLSIEFGQTPGKGTASVQRALVHLMHEGSIPVESTMEDLLSFVKESGFNALRDLGLELQRAQLHFEQQQRRLRALERKERYEYSEEGSHWHSHEPYYEEASCQRTRPRSGSSQVSPFARDLLRNNPDLFSKRPAIP